MKKSKSSTNLTLNSSASKQSQIHSARVPSSSNASFNPSNFSTLYSGWTPRVDGGGNKRIFQERLDLIMNWFSMWSNNQRVHFLQQIFSSCNEHQFQFVQDYVDKKVPLARVDFVKMLPRQTCLQIFSYLDPRSLSRASCASWHWKFITEQDKLWIPKCETFGWYLPYTPSENEFGAWKKHYISNAISIGMSLSKTNMPVWRRYALTESTEEKPNLKEVRKDLVLLEKSERRNNRPSWKPSNAFPSDLESSRKALLQGKDLTHREKELANEKTNGRTNGMSLSNKFGLLDQDSVKKHANQLSLYTFSQQKTPTMKGTLNYWMNKQDFDEKKSPHEDNSFRGSDLVKAGDVEPLAWQRPALDNIQQVQNISNCYKGWANPRIILLSSKLPVCEMLVESVIFGVIPIVYDYDASTMKTLIYDLESALKGRLARSIGVFGHRNSSNEMWLVKDVCLNRHHCQDSNINEFLQALARNTVKKQEQGHVDLFAPFGAFSSGVEMIQTISEMTDSQFFAPHEPIGRYKFILSEWYNSPQYVDVHPCDAYFVNSKLKNWLEFSEDLFEIAESIRDFVKETYPEIDQFVIKRFIGRTIQEVSLKNAQINAYQLWDSITTPLINCNPEKDPLEELYDFISKKLSKENNREKSGEELSKTKEESPFQKPSQRKTILKELIGHVKRFENFLSIIRDFYYSPLKRASSSNKPILGEYNIQNIFNDILLLIGPTDKLLLTLNNRVSNWSSEECIGDAIVTFCMDLAVVFKTLIITYPTSMATLDRCKETNSKFRGFLSRHDNQPESGMNSLRELFLKPQDMILDLLDLVQWYSSNLPLEHADILNLRKASTILNKINKSIVQERSRVKSTIKLLQIQDSILNCPILHEDGRIFITHAIVRLYDSPGNDSQNDCSDNYFQHMEDCGIFLFNDSLVITRMTKKILPYLTRCQSVHSFEMAVPLRMLKLFDIPDRKDIKCAFQLTTKNKRKKWYLAADSVDMKYHLTSTIRKYIELNM